jgi:Tfp pilus assembly pilus retraction ATPase PilT
MSDNLDAIFYNPDLTKTYNQSGKPTGVVMTDFDIMEAKQAIQSLINEARIDELKQLWNSTQSYIVPDGVEANDMSEELHKRIEKLRSEL